MSKKNIAVIGGGVSGIVSTHLLSKKHNVTLFEAAPKLGGHTNTIVLESGPDEGTPIDTGFIVLNDKNYPNFHAFLDELSVPWRYSDMSFSFSCDKSGLEWGSKNLSALFAVRSKIFSPSFYKFLFGVKSFWKRATKDLEEKNLGTLTIKEYAAIAKIQDEVLDHFIIPFAGAIWSSPVEHILDFPAESMIAFFHNHGMLSYAHQPHWQTVVGGSHSYVKAFEMKTKATIIKNAPLKSISRQNNQVRIEGDTVSGTFDAVVIATHADSALKLLKDPTINEQKLLGVWNYQRNDTILHTDTSTLPKRKAAWASWNYKREESSHIEAPVTVTYDMTKLQGLNTHERYLVTLNPSAPLKNEIKKIIYHHPVYSKEAVASQIKLHELQGVNNTFFAGSYFGWGFHEDAVKSAVMVGKHFDCGWSKNE